MLTISNLFDLLLFRPLLYMLVRPLLLVSCLLCGTVVAGWSGAPVFELLVVITFFMFVAVAVAVNGRQGMSQGFHFASNT